MHVMPKPGVTDPEAESARALACATWAYPVTNVRTIRTYRIEGPAEVAAALIERVLSNDAVEVAVIGALPFRELGQGQPYQFQRVDVSIRDLDDQALAQLSRDGPARAFTRRNEGDPAAFRRASAATRPTASSRPWPRPGASTVRTRRCGDGSRFRGERSTTCSSRRSSARPTSWLATGW